MQYVPDQVIKLLDFIQMHIVGWQVCVDSGACEQEELWGFVLSSSGMDEAHRRICAFWIPVRSGVCHLQAKLADALSSPLGSRLPASRPGAEE